MRVTEVSLSMGERYSSSARARLWKDLQMEKYNAPELLRTINALQSTDLTLRLTSTRRCH